MKKQQSFALERSTLIACLLLTGSAIGITLSNVLEYRQSDLLRQHSLSAVFNDEKTNRNYVYAITGEDEVAIEPRFKLPSFVNSLIYGIKEAKIAYSDDSNIESLTLVSRHFNGSTFDKTNLENFHLDAYDINNDHPHLETLLEIICSHQNEKSHPFVQKHCPS